MAELPGFEDAAREAFVDEIEATLAGQQGSLAFSFVRAAHENLRDYGERFDYDVEPIIDSLGQPEVTRSANGVSVRVGWTHEAAPYMEFGTPRHSVEGQPVLSFVWEERHDPPPWVREEFEPEGDGWRVFLSEVEVEGLPEGRWIRDALRFFELVVRGKVDG